MDISQLRSKFSVFVVDRAPQGAKSLAESLKAMGYNGTRFFPTLESALTTARNELPHVIVLDVGLFDPAVESFLMEIQTLSLEILTVLVSPGTHFLQGLQLVSRTLAYDCVAKPFVSSLELLQKVDRAASRLYFQFESEQLREFYGADPQPESLAPEANHDFDGGKSSAPALSRLAMALRSSAQTKELDEAVRIFIDSAARASGDAPVLYFKYVPSHLSLIFSQASLLPEEKFRGIGLDLKKSAETRIESFFANPGDSVLLRELIHEIFKKERFAAFSHVVDQEIVGLFVILGEVDLESHQELACLQQAFDLAYKRNQVIKEKHALDFSDALTGLSNRRHFFRVLDEEISRARRLFMPVSLVIIGIDQFDVLVGTLGSAQADAIVKLVSQLLRRISRTNDLVARIGPADFALILPHTAQMGGAMKAERLRRMIESTKFPILEKSGLGLVTISCGVSEYPSLAGDADGLMRSADEAQFEIKASSRNKVCLSAAPHGFQPDFKPREVPSSPRVKGGDAR